MMKLFFFCWSREAKKVCQVLIKNALLDYWHNANELQWANLIQCSPAHVFVFEWSFWRVIGRKNHGSFFLRLSIKVESWLNNYAYSEVSLNNQRQSLFINIYKVPFRTFCPFCRFQHSTLWILEKFFLFYFSFSVFSVAKLFVSCFIYFIIFLWFSQH